MGGLSRYGVSFSFSVKITFLYWNAIGVVVIRYNFIVYNIIIILFFIELFVFVISTIRTRPHATILLFLTLRGWVHSPNSLPLRNNLVIIPPSGILVLLLLDHYLFVKNILFFEYFIALFGPSITSPTIVYGFLSTGAGVLFIVRFAATSFN